MPKMGKEGRNFGPKVMVKADTSGEVYAME